MRKLNWKFKAVLLGTLLACGPVMATVGTDPYLDLGVVETGKVSKVLGAADEAREEVDESRDYRKLSDEDRQKLAAAHATLQEALAGVERFEDLRGADRQRAIEAQLAFRGVLSEIRGQREVCRRERPLGSRIAETVCYTQAALDRAREDARQITETRGKCANETCAQPRGIGQ